MNTVGRRLITTAIILGLAVVGWMVVGGAISWNRYMQLLPSQLHVTSISYKHEECWCSGLGLPGDNETGVIVYPLPDDTVARIRNEGAAFFDGLGPKWRGWKTTPIATTGRLWGPAPGARDHAADASPLDAFLNKWGFGIDVDPVVKSMIDRAIVGPDSFYVFRPGGLVVIVAPQAKSAFYIYAG